jgi:hypothetical protein
MEGCFATDSARWFYSCSFVTDIRGSRTSSRMGGRRDLVIDEMAQAVMGTERLGGGAVQSWVMRDDDP